MPAFIASKMIGPIASLDPTGGTPPGGDPYFSNVKLLLGLQSDSVDESGAPHTVTEHGTITYDTTTPPPFQSQSAGLAGSDYFTVPDSDDWNFGSGDFTVEGWWRHNTNAEDFAIAQWNGGTDRSWGIYDDGNGQVRFYWSTDGTDSNSLVHQHYADNYNWRHVAVSRSGNTLFLIYNEIIRATQDFTGVTLHDSSLALGVGANSDGGQVWVGRMAEWRITKGIGRYSGAVNDSITVEPPFQRY